MQGRNCLHANVSTFSLYSTADQDLSTDLLLSRSYCLCRVNVDRRRASTSANRSNVPAMAKPRAQSMQIASSSGHLAQPGVLKARANSDTNDAKASRKYVSGAKLAATGWETKTTGDGRVFFFHRAQQRFVPCGSAPNMGFS